MPAIGTIRVLALECRDPAPLAAFWSAALDREIVQRDDDWWSLEPGPGGSHLGFQVVPTYEPPPWPGRNGEQQAHLDIEVDDLDEATAAVVALGARPQTDVIDPGEEAWRVFLDPAGHPFCLVTLP